MNEHQIRNFMGADKPCPNSLETKILLKIVENFSMSQIFGSSKIIIFKNLGGVSNLWVSQFLSTLRYILYFFLPFFQHQTYKATPNAKGKFKLYFPEGVFPSKLVVTIRKQNKDEEVIIKKFKVKACIKGMYHGLLK